MGRKSAGPPGSRVGTLTYSEAELKVVDRFARAMARGKYWSTREAAPACAKALAKLRKRDPSLPERPEGRMRYVLSRRASELGLQWRLSRWTAAEEEMMRMYVPGVAKGRIPSISEAARELQSRFAKELGRKRSLDGIGWHIRCELRAMGIPAREQEWTKAEERVLRKYARKLYTGKPWTEKVASEACSKELGGRRSPTAVHTQLKKLVAEMRLPRYHGFSLDWELAFHERYARKMMGGEYDSWNEAALACHKAMARSWARRHRGKPYPRDEDSVYKKVLRMATKLGWRVKSRHRWTEEEDRMVEKWRGWLLKYRRVRRVTPMRQASEGLRGELAAKGFDRTECACRNRLDKMLSEYPG